ncbi:class II fructose-1,6-bisphosphate aldolase [Carboxydochorda subterranea]|uniref:Class II fructose-1,6-bisphosphate aldolase n=1 Tax=Carboxydichorda subterranea TaxID=3109565 RepID=A0ABZ1BWU1_9FIRM|nr:class II fructose-1,6-bisphosphate aldolase [Limnochorda sp. L945t]WRP17252.1 class II fructose-1,6-bisphosphate aldolase [Limnochorda sp. L945t]
MPLITLYQCLREAEKGGYGVGAFNVNNMEQIQGIMQAARQTRSPVILQASRGALKYTNLTYLKHLLQAALEENPDIPVVFHLDHGDSLETVKTAISLGFSSVMIDGSHLEFEQNVALTRSVVEYAHERGVSVEAELGTLGGIEEDVAGKVKLTDPVQAEEFVRRTGCDALAVAIGTSHGAYKFKAEPKLALDLVPEIYRRVRVPLVMHGSSSVPQELVEEVNRYGGRMAGSRGVPIESIQQAIKLGVRKINVDTDIRLAVTAAVRKVFVESPEKFDPREYLGPAREAIARVVASRMEAFGAAGHAGDYAPVPLEEMRAHYRQK